ncbi:unnamed protein product [Onchocerca flexuosa]|uniref:ZP domain-containing protein n=1 Tax=Onchocerca flexuosa TaxID=387005 RepID=A0A183HK88_9BILA|nr:unnamed protein product [Onchocerca flexuosa]
MGMLVKKCFVTDGEGTDHPVLDSDGCSLDNFLLGELVYDSTLMKAYAQSQVFKYADSNRLFFTCQIQLCQKIMNSCSGITPPKCSKEIEVNERRNRRSALHLSSSGKIDQQLVEMDVSSSEMLIGGIDDMLIDTSSSSCFSPFLIALSNFILFILITALLAIVVAMKKKHGKQSFVLIYL